MALRPLLPFQTRSLAPGAGALGDPFLALHREMNRMFDDVLRSGGGSGGLAASMIPVQLDVSETDKEIRITAELPGVAESDVQVELTDDILTIRGEKRLEREDAQHHLRERAYGTFSRSIQLPFVVDPNRLEASYSNGVLAISVPKEAARQQVHRIEIRPGSGGKPAQQSGSGQSSGGQSAGGRSSGGQAGARSASGQVNPASSGPAPNASGQATNLPPNHGPTGV
jgi:HSP20 family protein